MLQAIKNFISSSVSDSNNSNVVVQTAEQKIIERFEDYVKCLEDNPNIPKKVLFHLNELIFLVKDIVFEYMSIENQSFVRRVLESDIKIMLDMYCAIPKAHAVSVILENGKTAKDTLIENVLNQKNKINDVWQKTIEEKTEKLILKEKISKKKERKKDFFDM